MGGQACIFYGAAEFTRDSDFCILCRADNLDRLKASLSELHAEQVFFPPLSLEYLEKGHACHYVCESPGPAGFRIDVMGRMRNCPPFSELWKARSIFALTDKIKIPVMGLHHLVLAKKTQRDKDWPMVRRLIEADYAKRRKPDHETIMFWLKECRTPEILHALAVRYPQEFAEAKHSRALLSLLNVKNEIEDTLEEALLEEEKIERRNDKAYWAPLKEELERMRHGRTKNS